MRIGLPSQLRSSLPMLRVCVLLAAARAFRPPEWPAGERDALPPLGLNASWLADRVAGGQTFVARAGPLGDRAAELAFLRSHLLAPFHKHAATATATTAALALRGGDGSRAAAPPPAGVVGGLLAGLGERHHAVVETPLEARLSVVARLEKLFDGDASDAAAAAAVSRLFPAPLFDLGRGDTAHVYVSPPGGAALANHTDENDVVVLQVSGAKDWTVCAPVANEPKRSTCATYDAGEMSALDLCSRLTLYPGDLLFVPERSVHSARALDDAPSTHLTLGLRGGADLRAAACGREASGRRLDDACDSSSTPCPANYYSPSGYYSGSSCGGNCDDSCDTASFCGCEGCDSGCDTSCSDCGACEACPAGQYSDGTSTSCAGCPEGTYGAAEGGGCVACPEATYGVVVGETSCVPCPAGQVGTGGTGNTWDGCVNCPSGQYAFLAETMDCLDCPAGTWSAETSIGATECSSCPAG